MTRNFLNIRALLCCSAFALCSPLQAQANPQNKANNRPNIIFILVDDMGYSDIGCYGGEISTPNIDQLAQGGIRFTQMHNTSKCFPSRACLLTGVYAQQCGMAKSYNGIVNAVTLGDVARSAGYRTLASGKHHSNESLYEKGFDRYFGLRDGASNHFNPGLQREGEGVPAQKRPGQRVWCFDDKVHQPYTPKEKDFYTTDYFTKYALSYLDEYKDEDKPFLLYLSYTAPHDPLHAWPDDIAKYENTYKVGYKAIREARYQKMQRLGMADANMKLSAPTHTSWKSLTKIQQQDEARRMAVYAAMIDCLDQNIGRLIAKLKQQGKFDTTLILFASDNGSSAVNVETQFKRNKGQIGDMTYWSSLGRNWANVSNTPYRYNKNDSYQGGICTPFIAHWPKGIKNAGSFDNHPRHFVDVMPTLLKLTKAEYPTNFRNQTIAPLQGESFLPALSGKATPDRLKPIFWQWARGKAIRKGHWKVVAKNDKWQLFDMNKDHSETTDLQQQHPEVMTDLKKLYNQWEQQFPSIKKKAKKAKKAKKR